MENRDKIFDQFKNAAENVSPKEFASMESVWNRVEEKLDTTVLKKETKTWKKIAVAASILLCVSIGYQFFKLSNELIIPDNNVVTNEKPKVLIDDKIQETESAIAPEYPNIKDNADKILQNSTATENIIAYNEPPSVNDASPMPIIVAAPQASEIYEKAIVEVDDAVAMKKEVANSKTHFFKAKIYDARGVKQTFEEVSKQEAVAIVKQETKKQNPLYVIDGESVANNKNKDTKVNLTADDIENIVVLKEPLYIINGIEFSEESLFGAKLTSPYAPLDQQEIIKTEIFQGDEAIEIYGEKGRKGVVVVTTKNGKAVKK
jgi:hypothetical protein